MNTAKTLNITDFMAAWFDGNYAVIGEGATREHFEAIKTDYIDMAGLYASRDFDMTYNLLMYENRLNVIQNFMIVQRGYIDAVGVPKLDSLDMLERFNHVIIWQDDKEKFLKKLEQVDLKENKTRALLNQLEKQITDNNGKKEAVFVSQSQERKNFMSMIINLEKNGYKIDEVKTTVEKLAIMIQRQREEYERMMAESRQGQAGDN